jgi:hypothetical protein
MPQQSIKGRTNAIAPAQMSQEVRALFESVLADLTALRAAQLALLAKMDTDFADVTNASTNYAATCTPAALNTVE